MDSSLASSEDKKMSRKRYGSDARYPSNLNDVIRSLKISYLQARNGDRGVLFTFLGAFLSILLVLYAVFSFVHTSQAAGDFVSGQETFGVEEKFGRCTGGKFFGEGTPVERAMLKEQKVAVIKIPSSAKSLNKVVSTLCDVERRMNAGWNKTGANVVPLGDADYVRRDLPVYKAGFDALGYNVLKRPKMIYTAEQLQDTTEYNMILCLSFNTDKCFNPEDYLLIGRTRKINRLKGLRDVLWSKDKFCRTIKIATSGILDKDLLSFAFPCWILPGDYKDLMEYSREHKLTQWIVKPRSLGAGKGIEVLNSIDELALYRRSGNVVQQYLEDPHLVEKPGIDGTVGKFKWDMRTYVLVTSITPLRAYLYDRGLVRFATMPYTKKCTNKTSCLTNTSINKHAEGAQLKDITWSFYKLKKYLSTQPDEESWSQVFLRVQKAIGLTLISAESSFVKHYKKYNEKFSCANCYHLLGVDIIFDANLDPKVVEVNGEPSLKLTSNGRTHYDITKKSMGKDLIKVVYSQDSGVLGTDLSQRLIDWSKCLPPENKKTTAFLGKDHLEYIIDTFRESRFRTGFKPIYPNPSLKHEYDRYLEQLHNKESKLSDTFQAGGKRHLAHKDGRRLRLHRIVSLLQDKAALKEHSFDEDND